MNKETTETFDLNTLDLESHVKQAWYLARALAEGQPINAAHGIKAAAIVGSDPESTAFRKLRKLVENLQPLAQSDDD